jgi:hypothetical protein
MKIGGMQIEIIRQLIWPAFHMLAEMHSRDTICICSK